VVEQPKTKIIKKRVCGVTATATAAFWYLCRQGNLLWVHLFLGESMRRMRGGTTRFKTYYGETLGRQKIPLFPYFLRVSRRLHWTEI